MYILITEDWTVFKSEKITVDDLESVSNGYLDIIDITDPAKPKRAYSEGWIDIDNWQY